MKNLSLLLCIIVLTSCSGTRPTNIGIQDKKNALLDCPEKPNCITSYKSSAVLEGQYLEAFQGSGNKAHDHQKVLKIINANSSAKVIKQNENYIYAEYTSSIIRFVDDVEFYFGDEGKVHFRSASRIGRSDLGVNKKRIEEIRFKFQQSF